MSITSAAPSNRQRAHPHNRHLDIDDDTDTSPSSSALDTEEDERDEFSLQKQEKVQRPRGYSWAGAVAMSPVPKFNQKDSDAVYRLSREDTRLGKRVREAIEVTEEALERYGLDHIALSFNGGKDCTVLVHILAAVLTRWRNCQNSSTSSSGLQNPSSSHIPHSSISPSPLSNGNGSHFEPSNSHSHSNSNPEELSHPIKSVYVRCTSPFPQVEEFVHACAVRYNLDLVRVDGDMKMALSEYLEILKNQQQSLPSKVNGHTNGNGNANANGHLEDGTELPVKAILVGTRRGDPHGATLDYFSPTDPTWPDFMRVHPILEWSYKDVWDFLRCPDLTPEGSTETGVGWCGLYNYGYTSLGSTFNTFPNPRLVDDTLESGAGWRPAWELRHEEEERAGRGPPEAVKDLLRRDKGGLDEKVVENGMQVLSKETL